MARKKKARTDRAVHGPEMAGGADAPDSGGGAGRPALPDAPGLADGSRGHAAPPGFAVPEVPGLVVPVLAGMMFLAPAMGVPHEEMLQDTLKSIIVSFAALAAALCFFWSQRERREPLRWHGLIWLPLLLMAWALGSMVWSHTYLAAVEAIRWFVFALILWLGLQTFTRESAVPMAWAVHAGAVVASVWAVLQFWTGFGLFAQGPNPASTFVNRNFFAEFVVCTLPFTALLLARARKSAAIAALGISGGVVITAILMTGTRSALAALWLQLLVVLPLIGWRLRSRLAFGEWDLVRRATAGGVLLGTVLALGAIPTANPRIAEEGRGMTGIERGLKRTGTISPGDASLGVRMVMWRATGRIIADRPLTGVGAGAWENAVTLYQTEGTQLETDYYVHNEFLQLLAEYGLTGWVFLLLLAAYLVQAAWRTWRLDDGIDAQEGPLRAMALCSLLALMIVSNVGFPWRMAATGALFAVCLGLLAASDARLWAGSRTGARKLAWSRGASVACLGLGVICTGLAAYISQQAALAEQKIVHATKLALTLSSSGMPNHPRWAAEKAQMLQLIREGIAINPHYRKITPMVADELARWGDWKNATWIWESVLQSRPHIVAIRTNAARGHVWAGDLETASAYLEQARRIQPNGASVRSLEVLLLSKKGEHEAALARARDALNQGIIDIDLINNAYGLSVRAGDFAFATRLMEVRMQEFPALRAASFGELAKLHANAMGDPQGAVVLFVEAMRALPARERYRVLADVPPELRAAVTAAARGL